jgi:hypothetical protein
MSAVATLASAPPARVVNEFSDRLSPMLVKELRQGLKSPFFVWGLVLMQAALGIGSMVMMGDTGNEATLFFWWASTGVICILLPLRAANALRDEMSGNTLDTLVLTRLSAWRITLGKWIATASLQVLMAITVLPYLIMRYFAGGVNLPHELMFMAMFTLFGMVATAIMLGLSFFRYFLIRAAVMLGVLAGCTAFCAGAVDVLEHGTDRLAAEIARELGWMGSAGALLLTVWVAYFFLDLGASQIAPLAENRSTRRRLVAIGLFSAAAACFWFMEEVSNAMGWTIVIGWCVILVCIQAVCEKPALYPPVLQPFVKRGLPGRLAGRLLYPGWPSGMLLTFILLIAVTVLIAAAHYRYWDWLNRLYTPYGGLYDTYDYNILWPAIFAAFAAVAGAVVLPLLLWRLLSPRQPWHFGRWFLLLLIPAVWHGALFLANHQAESRLLTWAHVVVPTSGFVAYPAGVQQARWDRDVRRETLLAAALPKIPSEKRRLYELPEAERKVLRGYYDEIRESYPRQMQWASLASLGLWGALGLVMAARAFRQTRAAERELEAEILRVQASN